MNTQSTTGPEDKVPWSRRITVRTVLLSWLVGLLSVGIFIGFALPAAKRVLLAGFESKAVAIATAAASESDESAETGDRRHLADHCRKVLANDSALVYIALSGSNGVTEIHRRSGIASNADDPRWLDDGRKAHILLDPETGQNVFHVFVPVAESRSVASVCVGLLSKQYDESMRGLYRSVVGISILCALVALATSIYYARRLVHPLKELRAVVQRVAAGDWTARASARSHDEVGELARSLNAMTGTLRRTHDELRIAKEAAEAASEAKSMFLATVSHEIRTPINGVIGMLKLIKDSPLDTRQQAQVNTAITSARALLSVIEGILDFSKIEAGKIEFECIDFDLPQVVDSAVMMFAERAREKGLTLQKQIAADVPLHLKGDSSRVSQILINLIANAVKFTSKGGVCVKITPEPGEGDFIRLLFEVCDTGIGIPPAQHERLFTPFTQADNSTTRKYGGTGLGLAICKQLVELMGGRISLRSTVGEGTVFSVVLPFLPGVPPVAAEPPPAAPVPASESAFRKASILVVEDNNINAYVTRELLVRNGYACDVVVNGQEAVAAFTVKDYDLILMDIQMPVMDGYEATKAIREKERHRPEARMPIVALTANAMAGEKERCVAAGMDDYLVKPLDPEQMNRTIERLLRPDRKPAPGLMGREPVNYEELLHRCMRDEKLARQLLDEFIGQARETIAELRDHLASGDFTSLYRVAHRLKGTSATLACDHIRRHAALLETAYQEKSLPKRGKDLIDELETHIQDVAKWREIHREKELL